MERRGFSPDTIALYEELGHPIRLTDSIGSAMGVYHDRAAGVYLGAADSRADDGAAVGY
jgi:hypothetical protein